MKTPAQKINSKSRAEFLGDRETKGLKLKQKNGITNESNEPREYGKTQRSTVEN